MTLCSSYQVLYDSAMRQTAYRQAHLSAPYTSRRLQPIKYSAGRDIGH